MSALGDARFRRLLVGNSVSSFGDSALFLTLGIWAKDLTGSNAAAGSVFLAQGLPYLAAPFAGQLVDRVRRRPLLIAANAATAVAVLALLAVRSPGDLWIMYLVAVCYGAGFTIIRPAGAGLIKDLLTDRDLAGATAATVTIGQGLRLVSPLAGAALYARLGGGFLAVLDAGTFGVAIAALLSVRVTETERPARVRQPVRAELLAGAVHLRGTPLLSQVTLAATAAMLVIGFYESVTFAVIAAIGEPPSFFAVLMSIQAAGSIAGGVAAGPLIRAVGEARTLGIAIAAWALASVLYLVPLLPASCAAVAVFGIAVPLNSVSVRVATQRHTPAHLQGRTIAASDMATNLAQTLSITIGAALIGILGYRPLLVIVAAAATVAAIPGLARPAPSCLPRPIVDSGICSDSAGRRLMAPVLYVIACGGPPAGQLPDFVRFAHAADWDVCVIATPDGTKFMDVPHLAELTGHPVRVTYKNPDEPDVLPSADAFVIAPATFNLVNKLAHGISDTLALGLVNEAVGLDLPIIAVPWPNAALARHPVFQRSVAALRDWGVTVILDTARLPDAGQGPAVFPWDDLRGELARLRAAVGGAPR